MNKEWWTKWSGEALMTDPAAPVDVGTLKVWLEGVPDDTTVVLSSDAEGNVFKPLLMVGAESAKVTTESGYADVDFEDAARVRAIVLWPYD